MEPRVRAEHAEVYRGRGGTGRLEALSRLLDDSIPIPGTQYRVGIDAIIGLVPGIGDTIGTLLGTFVVWEGVRLGASPLTIVKMVGNVTLDAVIGAFPLLGDLFDFAFKANKRNVELLLRDLKARDERQRTSAESARLLGVMVILFLLLIVGVTCLFTILAVRALFG